MQLERRRWEQANSQDGLSLLNLKDIVREILQKLNVDPEKADLVIGLGVSIISLGAAIALTVVKLIK